MVMPASSIEIEERLWQMADRLRAHEYAETAPGLIFIKTACNVFKKADQEIKKTFTPSKRHP